MAGLERVFLYCWAQSTSLACGRTPRYGRTRQVHQHVLAPWTMQSVASLGWNFLHSIGPGRPQSTGLACGCTPRSGRTRQVHQRVLVSRPMQSVASIGWNFLHSIGPVSASVHWLGMWAYAPIRAYAPALPTCLGVQAYAMCGLHGLGLLHSISPVSAPLNLLRQPLSGGPTVFLGTVRPFLGTILFLGTTMSFPGTSRPFPGTYQPFLGTMSFPGTLLGFPGTQSCMPHIA